MINLYVGYDEREAAVFHVFNQSIIEHATQPVAIHPLSTKMLDFDGQQDGSNAFIYSRYLVPYLQSYQGWAIFCDGDMHVNADIAELWDLRDDSYAVQVIKHEYRTNHKKKYIGTPIESVNLDYPRKNWSSVMLFNCAHPAHERLTRKYVAEMGPEILHRFRWLSDHEIGELPAEWNHLVGEYKPAESKLFHHTLGSPGFSYYSDCESSKDWYQYLINSLRMVGGGEVEMVRRAKWA